MALGGSASRRVQSRASSRAGSRERSTGSNHRGAEKSEAVNIRVKVPQIMSMAAPGALSKIHRSDLSMSIKNGQDVNNRSAAVGQTLIQNKWVVGGSQKQGIFGRGSSSRK